MWLFLGYWYSLHYSIYVDDESMILGILSAIDSDIVGILFSKEF